MDAYVTNKHRVLRVPLHFPFKRTLKVGVAECVYIVKYIYMYVCIYVCMYIAYACQLSPASQAVSHTSDTRAWVPTRLSTISCVPDMGDNPSSIVIYYLHCRFHTLAGA